MSYPPQYGAQQPQYGTAQPAYGAGPGQYAGHQFEPPRRKRGLKRIIFGILGLLANAIGLVVMPFVAGVLVAVVALLGATPATIGGASGTVDASSTALTLVYVPTSEAASTTCTVEGTGEVIWDGEQSSVPATVDGTEYTPVGSITVTQDQQVTVQCEGASDVAVAEVGVMGTVIGFGVGVLVPVLLGLVALALLIWGIVARVRS